MRYALLLSTTCGLALGVLNYTWDGASELQLGVIDGSIQQCNGLHPAVQQRPPGSCESGWVNACSNMWAGMKEPNCPNGHWSFSTGTYWPAGVDQPLYYTDETCDEWDDYWGNHVEEKWSYWKFDVWCKICPDWAVAGPDACEYAPYATPCVNDSVPLPPQYQKCLYCTEPDEVVTKDSAGSYSCKKKCNGMQLNLEKRMENAAARCATPGGAPPKGITSCKPSQTSTSTPAPTGSSCPVARAVSNGGCKMNDAGLKLARGYEHCSAYRYTIAGHPTIGWGHDCTVNKDCTGPKFKEPMSSETAEEIFKSDVDKAAKRVISVLPNLKYLNSNQFSALVDFSFNGGYLKGLLPEMKAKKFDAMCAKITNTSATVDGKPNAGVKCRREAETALCKTSTAQLSGCS